MSISPCLVQCEIRPGFAPCSMTAVGPGSRPAGRQPADVHVPPVERSLGGMLAVGVAVRVPDLDRRVDVEHAVVVAPLQQLAAVDVPGQVDEQVAVATGTARAARPGSPASRARAQTATPCASHGPRASLRSSKSRMVTLFMETPCAWQRSARHIAPPRRSPRTGRCRQMESFLRNPSHLRTPHTNDKRRASPPATRDTQPPPATRDTQLPSPTPVPLTQRQTHDLIN